MGEEFNYMLLGRLQMDCEYYLGCGSGDTKHLCYLTEQAHISKMKELHNGFPEDKKPEWLSFEQILKYEKAMIGSVV